jgi:hypothetical protein
MNAQTTATQFTLTDARLLRTSPEQAVITVLNPRDFIAYIARGENVQAVANQFTERALALGWTIEVVQVAEYGDYVSALNDTANQPLIVFSLSHRAPKGKAAALKAELAARGMAAPVNTERVKNERFVVSNPANLRLERKAARIEAMAAVVEHIDTRTGYADIRQLSNERVYINRLFAEGLLERAWNAAHLMRPTSGGRLWWGR